MSNKITNLNKQAKIAISQNQDAFIAFARCLGAALEVPAILHRIGDKRLLDIFYDGEEYYDDCSGNLPIITADGIVKPWDVATGAEKEEFTMPIRQLLDKVLDIMLRGLVKTHVETKREGVFLLTARAFPAETSIEDKIRIARDIEVFAENYLR